MDVNKPIDGCSIVLSAKAEIVITIKDSFVFLNRLRKGGLCVCFS